MTKQEAIKLDQYLSDTNDTLYIAYTTECCKVQRAHVWIGSLYGDNSEEAANDDYCTRSISAVELNSLLLDYLHKSRYYVDLSLIHI